MTPENQVLRINKTNLFHAYLRSDGYIDIVADYAPAILDPSLDLNWRTCFVGAKLRNVKIQINYLSDSDLKFLGDAMCVEILNLHGNSAITGNFLENIPPSIGLQSIDCSHTGISDPCIKFFLQFPNLNTIWGHKNQFSSQAMEEAQKVRPELDFRLIY